jgi:translation elongation factor EF-Tu-like GTPase
METVSINAQLNKTEDGGRVAPFNSGYCPHLVVEGTSEMLGVRVVDCPNFVFPGEASTIKFELMYYPQLSYAALRVGARVAIVEGPKTIGLGTVVSRDAQ